MNTRYYLDKNGKPKIYGLKSPEEKTPELFCPACGHYPITLTGTCAGLTLEVKNLKAQCPLCAYEEK